MRNITEIDNLFFIGVAGTGMSAIAQYLAGIGKSVSGSDRQFIQDTNTKTRQQLETEGISCFYQDGSGINSDTEIIVVSTAIEESNPEYQKAVKLGIQIIHRAELLKLITLGKKTIAISGTSGKSTTVAMIFTILNELNLKPSLITGAGLISLQSQNKIGNAWVGVGEWLIIEADESDGSLVNYTPEIGVILNIDKDHKDFDELDKIFKTFKQNIKNQLIVNRSHNRTKLLSVDATKDFGVNSDAGINGYNFAQSGFNISFQINDVDFELPIMGKHNMENALAAIAIASYLGISLDDCAKTLKKYTGIYRRHQLIGTKNGITFIDDYAHNPVKIAAAIRACQNSKSRVIAWFQPHGYGPTRFLRKEFTKEISEALRHNDIIFMSEIYYAGGTVTKDISAADLINDLKTNNKNAVFVENRNNLSLELKKILKSGDICLLMGARDASLSVFAKEIYVKF